jgi:hypothetical protein
MFDQLLTVLLALLLASVHQLQDEGLQEKDWGYIGKGWADHEGHFYEVKVHKLKHSFFNAAMTNFI